LERANKFNKVLYQFSGGSRDFPYWRTDMTKLIVAHRIWWRTHLKTRL